MTLSFAPPSLEESDFELVRSVLESGWITTGPMAAEFEMSLTAWCQTPEVKVVNSGTAALQLGLCALGIGPGDEVITSAYTYAATAHAIHRTGASVVMVDVMPGSYAIDPARVAEAITPATKAVIAVDIGGVPCDYPELVAVATREADRFTPSGPLQEGLGRIAVVADAAHSLGALWHGRPSAVQADFTAFSFHAVKNLTTAEGGALTWSDEVHHLVPDLHTWASTMAVHGQSRDALSKTRAGGWQYDVAMIGEKWNLPDVLAALGLSQLRRYKQTLETRHRLADRYAAAFAAAGAPVTTLAHLTTDYSSSAHLMMVDLGSRGLAVRNGVIDALERSGVPANVHFKPLPMLTAYAAHGPAEQTVPHAFHAYANEVSLPLHPQLDDDDIEQVVDAFCRALASTR